MWKLTLIMLDLGSCLHSCCLFFVSSSRKMYVYVHSVQSFVLGYSNRRTVVLTTVLVSNSLLIIIGHSVFKFIFDLCSSLCYKKKPFFSLNEG